jgi:hypothetical protein
VNGGFSCHFSAVLGYPTVAEKRDNSAGAFCVERAALSEGGSILSGKEFDNAE